MGIVHDERRRKRTTRADVARLAGVSPSTVSRALSGNPLISGPTRELVRRVAEREGYVPSSIGRSHYQAMSFRLGLLVPFHWGMIGGEYFSRLVYGILGAAGERSYTLNVIADEGLSAAVLRELVLSKSVDGLILPGIRLRDRRFEELQRDRIPFVFTHHRCPEPSMLSVDADPRPGLQEAFEHLARLQVQRLGWVGGDEDYADARERGELVEELAGQYGLRIVASIQGGFSRSGGRRAARRIARSRPQAVLCANDRMAFGLLEGLRELGVEAPDHLRVIGFDNQRLSELSRPRITTIENPFQEVGYHAARLLLERLAGRPAVSLRLPTRLVLRESG